MAKIIPAILVFSLGALLYMGQVQGSPYVDQSRNVFISLLSVADLAKKGVLFTDTKTQLKVKEVSNSIDLERLSQLSFGKRWQSFTKAQRQRFKNLLMQLLEWILYPKAQKINVGIDQIVFSPKEKNIVDVKVPIEREVDGDLVKDTAELKFFFHKLGKQQKIYDAFIEGERLSTNLKRQFDKALEKKTFDQILDLMAKRVNKAKESQKKNDK